MANSTRRGFLRHAGFMTGTVLSLGGLLQLPSATADAQPVTFAAPVITAQAGDEALAAATALIAASTARVTTWVGPTDGRGRLWTEAADISRRLPDVVMPRSAAERPLDGLDAITSSSVSECASIWTWPRWGRTLADGREKA